MTRKDTSASGSSGGSGGAVPLSPLIHGRVRLLVLSTLLRAEAPLTFTELRALLGLTDGTLSVHLSKLVDGGLVSLDRRFVGKRPQTRASVTAAGRRAFSAYVAQLREIVPGLEA